MKNNNILILICLTFISCSSNKRDSFEYNEKSERKIWINSFKYEAFYGCIKEGIKNDSLRIILKNKDLFNKSLEIELNKIDYARFLGKQIIYKLPKPYIKINNNDQNKNFISFNCLKYYASRELDSIAILEYKKHLKSIK